MARSSGWVLAVAGLLTLVSATAFGAAAPQEASYFKWTDANGTVHVSATPPAGRQVTVLRLKEPAGSPDAASTEPLPSIAPTDELKQAQAAYREQSCAAARNDVRLLDQGAMVVSGKAPDAATKLGTEQRAQARLRAQQRIAQFCNGK